MRCAGADGVQYLVSPISFFCLHLTTVLRNPPPLGTIEFSTTATLCTVLWLVHSSVCGRLRICAAAVQLLDFYVFSLCGNSGIQ